MGTHLNIVRGNVDNDGTILAGTDFRVTHDKKGIYNILFDTGSFSGIPTVTACVISNGAADNKTRRNCVVQEDGLSPTGFTMITGDDDGDLSNRLFGFIAVGPTS